MPQSEFNLRLIEEFRANGGEVSGRPKGAPMLLLTTTGRKSGELRTSPMGYGKDGDNHFVVAMNGGLPKIPNWYWNLVANPEVTVEVGKETYRARAIVADGAEEQRLFAKWAEQDPRRNELRAKMTRRIPVVALERL